MHFSQNGIGESNKLGEETFTNQKKEYATEKGSGEPIVALASSDSCGHARKPTVHGACAQAGDRIDRSWSFIFVFQI